MKTSGDGRWLTWLSRGSSRSKWVSLSVAHTVRLKLTSLKLVALAVAMPTDTPHSNEPNTRPAARSTSRKHGPRRLL